jgi:hypothetical protein
MKEIEAILASDLPEMQKLSNVFHWITDFYIENSEHEIELYKALGDREALVKEQVKQSVFKHVQSIFQQTHLLVTKRKAWDE